jgi:hypothetical protein
MHLARIGNGREIILQMRPHEVGTRKVQSQEHFQSTDSHKRKRAWDSRSEQSGRKTRPTLLPFHSWRTCNSDHKGILIKDTRRMAHSSWVGQTNASERCKAIESSQRAGQADGIASILGFMHDGVVTLQHQWSWAEPRWSLPGNRIRSLLRGMGRCAQRTYGTLAPSHATSSNAMC